MKKKIIFYSNCWGDLRSFRDRYVTPVIHKVINQLPDYSFNIMFNEKVNEYCDVTNAAIECYKQNAAMFFVPPDTIFSIETIVNIITMFNEENIHIAIPHLRINRESFNHDIFNTNKELCSYAIKYLHSSAEYSRKVHTENLCHMGITIRDNGKSLILNHSLPTIYYCNFDKSDIEVLRVEAQNKYAWDSKFLAHVYKMNRVRVVGSSDFACCFETTLSNVNVAGRKINLTDEYKHRNEHNLGLGKFLYCLNYKNENIT